MHKSKDPEVTTIQKNDRAKRILQSNTFFMFTCFPRHFILAVRTSCRSEVRSVTLQAISNCKAQKITYCLSLCIEAITIFKLLTFSCCA